MKVKQIIKLFKDHPYFIWEQCIGYEVLLYCTGDNDKALKKVLKRKIQSISCDGDFYTIIVGRR